MEAKELMIVNYFINDLNDVANITEIESDGVLGVTGQYRKFTYFNLMQPIPLTEEWLGKFGFKKIEGSNNYYHPKTGSICFTKVCEPHNYYLVKTGFGSGLTSVKYIHQLQNLYFALTGEELEVVQ